MVLRRNWRVVFVASDVAMVKMMIPKIICSGKENFNADRWGVAPAGSEEISRIQSVPSRSAAPLGACRYVAGGRQVHVIDQRCPGAQRVLHRRRGGSGEPRRQA